MSYRMAVVGTGGLGMMLGRQVRRSQSDLVAVADVSDESRTRAGAEFDLPADARYETLDGLLAGETLDGVVIATPHTLHYDQIVQAMDHDLHVLCEKPLVTDLDRARDLHRRAEAADTVLMVGYQRHLEPEFRHARARWAEGDATPAFLSAEITEDWLDGNVGTWRVNPALSGGGFFYDTGNHVIDAILWTTGLTPDTVRADMDFYEEDIDVRGNITIEFAEGSTAHISCHADVPRVRERLSGWDADGCLRITGREWGARSLTLVREDGSEVDPYIPERDSAYATQRTKLEAFEEAIAGEAPPPATTEDALRATAVTDAVYEAGRTDDTVSVDL